MRRDVMRHKLRRLIGMSRTELVWRARVALRIPVQRGGMLLREPRWRRRALLRALSDDARLGPLRAALAAGAWDDAHRLLSASLAVRPSGFLIAPQDRSAVAQRIRETFRSAAADAASQADCVLRGEYDLLGYRRLRFAAPGDLPDWHRDPVHDRRAPGMFWADVPFLDPACGDHKIIWELNRHQHWLVLGRAYWLTGDRRYRARCLQELESWLASNPPLVGVNWASMLELGLRSLSWIWALHFFVDADSDDAAPWTIDLLLALDRQLAHVEQNLSYYFSPNTHLLGEALALYVAGRSIPELAGSPRRAALGRRILVAELVRQVTPDGGHCERSTHYHRYTLDFYAMALGIARATDDPIAAVFERGVLRLASAARLLCDESGRAPHLGDDDGGMLLPIANRAVDDWRDSLAIAAMLTGRPELQIGPVPEEACWLLSRATFTPAWQAQPRTIEAAAACWRSAALPETGYYVSRAASGEHLIIDGGPHGYQNAGHAHADALAMTLSVRGMPVLIDPGTGCYTVDAALRDRFRSTALHNTLLVDGRSQSLPAGPFHWERGANGIALRWRTADAFDYFDGVHDGYAPVIHRRRVLALHGDAIIVADHLDDPARREHAAAVHWHIDPAWEIEPSGRTVTFRSRHERIALIAPHGTIETVVSDPVTGLGWHSPVYGRIEAAATVTVTCEGAAPVWIVSVFDLNPLDPIQDAAVLPVWAEAGTIAHALGLRIARRGATDVALFAEPAAGADRPTWRVAELETDARVLLCTIGGTGAIARLAIVDGSFVRGSGRRAFAVGLGRTIPSLYIDESSIGNYTPCAASPAS
jgi:uncharacterized heparinase superfamily protein